MRRYFTSDLAAMQNGGETWESCATPQWVDNPIEAGFGPTPNSQNNKYAWLDRALIKPKKKGGVKRG